MAAIGELEGLTVKSSECMGGVKGTSMMAESMVESIVGLVGIDLIWEKNI